MAQIFYFCLNIQYITLYCIVYIVSQSLLKFQTENIVNIIKESILNNSKVKIIGITDLGEKISAAAGRISTREGRCSDMLDLSEDSKKNIDFISRVTGSGHNSIVEHTYFNLIFEDVSVFFEQFLIEFRLMSFTVKSRRYVDFNDVGFYIPENMKPQDEEKYKKHMNTLFSAYGELLDLNILKEDARFILPYSLHSNIFCSLNARELIHLLFVMLYGRKSHIAEIKTLGLSILKQVKEIAPGILNNFEERSKAKLDNLSKPLKFNKSNKSNEDLPLVELLSSTDNPYEIILKSELVYNSGYSRENANQYLNDNEFMNDLMNTLVKSERPRALEHASYSFQFNNVSLPCLTHFARHRIWSLSIPPLEDTDRTAFKIPPSIMENEKALKIVKEKLKENIDLYNEFIKKYDDSITCYLLLSGNTLSFTGTMNARELILFLKLRTCNRAQWEIRDYANDMLEILRDKSPLIFNHYGPSCYVLGKCPEGKLTCGKFNEVVEKFKV